MNQTQIRAPWLQAIARVFADNTVYAVGGAVRNALMDLPVSDFDLCGKLRPAEVQQRCEGTPVTARMRAAHFGTVELHIDGHMAEYTTFRQDSYRGGHQPSAVRFADTVEEDALRRDFSVNALYTPLDQPSLVIDVVGGLAHLQNRVLHTVTEDPDQVLKDDGLRILRAVRFQAELGLVPTDAVLRSAKKYVGLLDAIAPERKRDELQKLLTSDTKYPSLSRSAAPVSSGLTTMVHIGAWGKLFGTLQPVDFKALDRAATLGAGGKLAILFCKEDPVQLNTLMLSLHFSKRETASAAEALAVLQALQNEKSKSSDVMRYGLQALQTANTMLQALDAASPACRRADDMIQQIRNHKLPAGLKEMAIGGDELLALCTELDVPTERIGSVLEALWRAAANGEIANESAALLASARKQLIDSQKNG